MADNTLDCPEVQVLVNYPNDAAGFFWHHRVLLHRVEGAKWLALTPDHEIQLHDLSLERHKILDRRAPFPADLVPTIYAHDPIGRAVLSTYKRRAKVQAVVLGQGDLEESEAFVWVVSQSGHRKFGEEVDAALLEDETSGLAFSAKGVVVLDGEEVFVEKVEVQKMEAWRKDRMLEGGDARLLGDHRDASGRRRLDLATAVELMKSEPDDEFPISGVRAAKELHDAICSGPGNLVSYHSEWLRLSGVSRKSSAAHIHSSLCECLRLLHSYDQIDASSTAVGEHLSRWMVQTELAVERNPMAPDYAGLDIVAGTAVQADGRASTGRFNEWVSSRLRERAQIWKQERLYAQERRGLRGKKGGGKGDESDSENEPGKNKQKKKKKGGKPGDGGGKGSRGDA
ncbi:unnamed protein product [Effrenium voratum]|nr:unnamed protein product [Effrenium voratum]